MAECTCGESFRTGEDYRDHLPCGGTPEEKRIRELEFKIRMLELKANRLEQESLMWKRRAAQHGCDVENGDPECG